MARMKIVPAHDDPHNSKEDWDSYLQELERERLTNGVV